MYDTWNQRKKRLNCGQLTVLINYNSWQGLAFRAKHILLKGLWQWKVYIFLSMMNPDLVWE